MPLQEFVGSVQNKEEPPAHFKELSILGEFFLERGANLESRAAHTHPKNTQVPPRKGFTGVITHAGCWENTRLRVVPHCSSRIVERVKRERA